MDWVFKSVPDALKYFNLSPAVAGDPGGGKLSLLLQAKAAEPALVPRGCKPWRPC